MHLSGLSSSLQKNITDFADTDLHLSANVANATGVPILPRLPLVVSTGIAQRYLHVDLSNLRSVL
jgi:hypothetical protein